MKKRNWFKVIGIILCCVMICGIVSVLLINARVKAVGQPRILSVDEAAQLKDVDCIIVLGCQVYDDGSLSGMLHDRLRRGVELYEVGVSSKLLMSGDHGRNNYNEVGAMKAYAIEKGIPSEDVFMDHAGFSTYDTICRAKDVFLARKVVIVTQEYHLPRALYIAEKLGMQAYGVSADYYQYIGQTKRDVREVAARCKDFVKCIFKPDPMYLGEAIPVSGDGNLTDDH